MGSKTVKRPESHILGLDSGIGRKFYYAKDTEEYFDELEGHIEYLEDQLKNWQEISKFTESSLKEELASEILSYSSDNRTREIVEQALKEEGK